jgi:hypothetical protein
MNHLTANKALTKIVPIIRAKIIRKTVKVYHRCMTQLKFNIKCGQSQMKLQDTDMINPAVKANVIYLFENLGYDIDPQSGYVFKLTIPGIEKEKENE